MVYVTAQYLLFIGFLWVVITLQNVNSNPKCFKNEQLRCQCFESSCFQLLYDGEQCPPCREVCHCKPGFVRDRGMCVKKEKCCSASVCISKKEEIIRLVRQDMPVPIASEVNKKLPR